MIPTISTDEKATNALRNVGHTPDQTVSLNFHEQFKQEFAAVKRQYGHGQYSYAEGMTRKAARRIARNRAALAAKEQRQ